MVDQPITITVGLPEAHRTRAAQLYYEAFRQKLHPIFRDQRRGTDILRESLNPPYAIAALIDDELVGIAGYKDAAGSLIDIQPRTMTQTFGVIGGWAKLLALSVFSRPVEPKTLLMDGIVVDPAMRSLGIGSRLLDAILAVAQQRGDAQVRLDVVDTNPRARQLYERKGFVPVSSHSFPLVERVFGFAGSTTMIRTLPKTVTTPAVP